MLPAHRHSNAVTRYTSLLTHTWDRLSDHQQLDTDRAIRILDLQHQLERLDVRLLADPTDEALAERLEDLFAAIDIAVDDVRDFLDDDNSSAFGTARSP